MSFSRRIAARYLWSKRSEAFITIITIISILGVAIGVMVLNIVMAVMTGFEYELKSKLLATNAHITVRRVGGPIQNWEQLAGELRALPEVASLSPFTYNQALLRTDVGSAGVLIRGVAEGSGAAEDLQRYLEPQDTIKRLFVFEPQEVQLEEGESDTVELPTIFIGRELQKSYGIFEGQTIALLSPQVSSSPFGLIPKFRRFVVAGTYNSGLVGYESGLAYVNLTEAQKFFTLGEGVSGLEVRVRDIDRSRKVTDQISGILQRTGAGLYAQDWTEMNRPLIEALRLERRVYFIVLLLIVVMASFSIIATLVMIVLEKRRDIAILQTLGASSRAIGNIFRIQGAVVGAIGTALGLLLGAVGCLALRQYGFPLDERIFQMSTVPVHMELTNFLITGGAAFLICCLATIYPARRASSLIPSEVLRYE